MKSSAKRVKISANTPKQRLILFFFAVCFLCVLLTFRVGQIQIIDSEKYKEAALEQQTRDTPIAASRGIIYDRNKKELAISATTNTVWVFPSGLASGDTTEEKEKNVEKAVNVFSKVLGMKKSEVREIVTQKKSIVKLAKYVTQKQADQIREAGLSGISIAEDVKRYYPLGSFASHLLGSTTDDNQGLSGIELQYNKYLSGVSGRWIKNADISGSSLTYGLEKYYPAEDGLSVVLTIDEVIQHYVEKAIKTVQADTQAKRVMCLMMDPETGEVLAMAKTPEYDPNDPRTPLDEKEAKALKKMDGAQQVNFWNEMWRNPLVSDTYEPGSTFKLITTSIALEEGVTNLGETFCCTGIYQVADTTLKCWNWQHPHGTETLSQAVQNSCNPVFIQLAQRIGKESYYDYLERFGITEKTGIDYPGEAGNILQAEANVGPVELATISYGQGIAVTPISLLTAVSAIGNEGKMMQPHLVKALLDADGNEAETYEPSVVRQVISEQTASEMCQIMESVVAEGGGGNAKIEGYRIGGKTGTANKAVNGGYSEDTCSSFIGMAPMDDPKVAILLIVDSPVGVKYGSVVAAPGVKLILEDVLRYLDIQPKYTKEEQEAQQSTTVSVPDVTGEACSIAAGKLAGLGLAYSITGTTSGEEKGDVVADQYPKAGTVVEKGSAVSLYLK